MIKSLGKNLPHWLQQCCLIIVRPSFNSQCSFTTMLHVWLHGVVLRHNGSIPVIELFLGGSGGVQCILKKKWWIPLINGIHIRYCMKVVSKKNHYRMQTLYSHKLSRHHCAQKPTCRLMQCSEFTHFSKHTRGFLGWASKCFLIVTLFSPVFRNEYFVSVVILNNI
jgi:hypothetical protein